MHTHRLLKTFRELQLAPPRKRAPSTPLVALTCPYCGRTRYFPQGEELYVDEYGRKSHRRCDRC